MIKIIESSEKRLVDCRAPFYPYDEKDNFSVSLKKGKNEVEFETEDHFNRFVQAATGLLMGGEINISEVKENTNDL